MTRRLLNLLTALSLLLCVAVVVLWVRSHRTGSTFGFYTERGTDGWYRNIYCASHNGRLSFLRVLQRWDADLPRGRFHALDYRQGSPGTDGFAGFSYDWVDGRHMAWVDVTVPYWSIALALWTMPAWAAVKRLQRRHRSGQGRCPSCGYDLRATPGRCPECGTITPSPSDA